MATKIRGITVEIGGDTSGLEKALKSTNKEIKSTQSQLKDVEKLLKLDPTNVTLLKQKHELLTKSVTENKEKLEELKKAEQQLKDAGVDENSEQFMALQREIVSTENSLKDMEDAANKSNVALSKISATADKVASSTAKAASATKGLSTAAGAALGGIVAAGYSAAVAADDYNTLAKQTGLSTETLQEAKYAADLIDVSYDTFTGSIAKMTAKLRTNEEGFNEFGVATRDASGELLTTEEIFWNACDALSQMENETERDIAAQELFGKSAADLAGYIDDGGEAFRGLAQEAKDAGLIMSQETLDGLNSVNDEIDTLKAKATATLATSGAKALEALTPIIDVLAEKLAGLLEWVSALDAGQMQTIMTILAVVAAISPLLSAISKLSSAISFVTSTVIPALSSAISFLVANPIGALIAAIVALVVLIVTKGEEIKAFIQGIDDWLQNVFARDWTEIFGPILGEGLNQFFANVKNIWNSVKSIFDGIIDFIQGVFTGNWSQAWNGVKEIFSGVFNGLLAIAKAPLNGIVGLINGVINGINWFISKWNGLASKTGGTIIGSIANIPYLAKGGVLSSGAAIVGEAGPEILTMTGGKTVVTPLGSSSASHGAGLDDVIKAVGNLGNQISSMGLYLDGKTLVGGISEEIDRSLGSRTVAATRGY